MRVLMVNKFLYPRAGAETYMLYVAQCLEADGHEVALFGMEHPENAQVAFRKFECPRLEFGRGLPPGQKAEQVGRALKHAVTGAMRQLLLEACEAFKPDLIHAHNVYNQLSPALFRKMPESIPVLMTAHDYKPVCPNYSLFVKGKTCTRCLQGSVLNCVLHRCCQDSLPVSTLSAVSSGWHRFRRTYENDYAGFIAPSRFMRDRLIEGGLSPEQVEVIHNFAQLPKNVTPPGNGFLYAGRLCWEKGVDLMLSALARLGDNSPPLTIAGEGPLEEELKAFARQQGLTNIRWLGRVSPDQVVEELRQCAVSVIPSRWFENCSMSIMESLASGRPCVVSDSGGNAELVEPGRSGWVFPNEDVDALVRIFRQVLTEKSRLPEMGQWARDAAARSFSETVHMQKLYTVYARLKGQPT